MKEDNFASLGPSLLARKGGAKPAMRRLDCALSSAQGAEAQLNDLGWNDMGDAVGNAGSDMQPEARDLPKAKVVVTDIDALNGRKASFQKTKPAKPAVKKQQESLADNFVFDAGQNQPAAVVTPRQPSTQVEKRVAFTLRLDRERHLKLRLASTMRGTSAQQIVTEAVDRMLNEMTELETLAAQLRQS